MISLTPITNRQVWTALRDMVPGLPETTEHAVLRVDRHQAWLEWRETRQEADGAYSLMQVHQWPTQREAEACWRGILERLHILSLPWEEVRIELRDLHETRAAVIEGRLSWGIEGESNTEAQQGGE